MRVDPKYYRPTEVELLWGDPAKAQKQLGWKRKVSLDVIKNFQIFKSKKAKEWCADDFLFLNSNW